MSVQNHFKTVCLICMSSVLLRAKLSVCAQPNTTQNRLPMNKSRTEAGGMVHVCAERWNSELGSLNGAGLGGNIDLELASAGSKEAVRKRVHVSVSCVFLHKAVVFSP